MRVNEVRLINVRGFNDTQISFSKSVNILVGKNNSGKSTIIKSVYLLQNGESLQSIDISKTYDVGFVFVSIDDISQKDLSSFKLINNEPFKVAGNGILVKNMLDNFVVPARFYFNTPSVTKILPSGEVLLKEGTYRHVEMKQFGGISNSEASNNFIYPFFSKRKSNIYSSRVGLKDIYNVSEDFRYLIGKIKKLTNPGHPRYSEFTQHCTEILGFKIGIIPEDNDQENIGLFVTDTSIISIQQMGDGVMHIVGLLAMLLTENNKLYLIEELENDLHPSALKSLLELIIEKSKLNQFIISTHSNIVLKYLGTNETTKIFEVESEFISKELEGNKVLLPYSTIKEIENTPEERMNILLRIGYEPWDFEIYKAYLILEESSAETLINDFLIPNFAPELCFKLRTVAAGGTSQIEPRFQDLLRLFVFINQNSIYQKKAWVIADGDESGINTILSLKEKFRSWNDKHFLNFSKENFEEFYPERFASDFESIRSITDKRKRWMEKIRFNRKVCDWITGNHELALKEFEASAQEVIKILQELERKIKE